MNPFLLAFDIGALITVIFFIIAFIGWISQAINSRTQPEPVRRRRPRQGGQGGQGGQEQQRDSSLQREIDKFLNEVGGQRQEQREPAQARTPARQYESYDEIEVVAEPEAARHKSTFVPTVSGFGDTSGAPPNEISQISQRHLASGSDLGRALEEHLSAYMQTGKSPLSEHQMRSLIDAVDQNADSAALRRREANADHIVQVLRNPGGVRDAIIINEILKRPRVLDRN